MSARKLVAIALSTSLTRARSWLTQARGTAAYSASVVVWREAAMPASSRLIVRTLGAGVN